MHGGHERDCEVHVHRGHVRDCELHVHRGQEHDSDENDEDVFPQPPQVALDDDEGGDKVIRDDEEASEPLEEISVSKVSSLLRHFFPQIRDFQPTFSVLGVFRHRVHPP